MTPAYRGRGVPPKPRLVGGQRRTMAERSDELPEDAWREITVARGNQWHFGMKAHIGVDSETGIVHSMSATGANVDDVTEAHNLLHGGETVVWGDAGYQGRESGRRTSSCRWNGRRRWVPGAAGSRSLGAMRRRWRRRGPEWSIRS